MKSHLFFRHALVSLCSCAVLLAGSSSANAVSTDYFLKFDGINGESLDRIHRGWSDVASFNWGVTMSAPLSGGAGGGKASFSDFSWTQSLDSSVTTLFSDISTGKHIKSAVIDFSTVSTRPLSYFRMSFSDVVLTSVVLGGVNGAAPGFSGSFAYGQVTLDYWGLDAKGGLGPHSSASYDLQKGAGSVPALAALFARGMMGPQVAVVPEPESYAMLLAGLCLLTGIARRRKTS